MFFSLFITITNYLKLYKGKKMGKELEKRELYFNGVFNFDDEECHLEKELSLDEIKLLDQVSGKEISSSEDDFFYEQELILGKSFTSMDQTYIKNLSY